MTPILGIMASSISGSKAVTTAYESIATTTVGSGGAANITFSSIAATYTHLQIRGIIRGTTATPDYNGLRIQLNSDTGANYAWHELFGDGATAASYSGSSTTYMDDIGILTGGTNTANIFGANIIDILDYASTTKTKTVRSLSGQNSNNTYGGIRLSSGLWNSTSAVTSIKLFYGASATIAEYSSFALYGIKGA